MATRFANTINELLEGVGRLRLLLTADVGSRSGVGDRVLCRDGMLEVIDKCRARLSLALQSIEYLAHTKGAVFLRSAATSTHGLLDGMAVIVQRVTSMVNLSVDVAMVIEGAIELDSEVRGRMMCAVRIGFSACECLDGRRVSLWKCALCILYVCTVRVYCTCVLYGCTCIARVFMNTCVC
jgi:hypothetical protein